MRLFTNEIVFRGHPDKTADQIGDAILDECLKQDSHTRCGLEVTGGKGMIFITGELTTEAEFNLQNIVRDTLEDIGYNPNVYTVIDNIGRQNNDIAQGVDTGGAGDNGMMVGYACNDTEEMLPTAQLMLQELSAVYDTLRMVNPNYKPDGKAQITGYYDEDFKLQRIKTLTICYHNTEKDREYTDDRLRTVANSIANRHDVEIDEILFNPTGRFEIGGFEGDAGVLGRKIVVDSYQGFANVGGGAQSGKCPTKVDRSGAYKARQIAKRYLKELDLKWCEVQIGYSIGIEEPMSIYIDSDIGYIKPARALYEECKPKNIIRDLELYKPIFKETSKFGHYGNSSFKWELI